MKKPFPYQQKAIAKGVEYFSKNARGKMIMPCGSGKTLTGLWLAQELEAKSLIIAFPNLHLEAQTVETWLSDFKELRNDFKILVLGSDKKLGKLFEVEVTTNEDDIINFLKKNQKENIVIFTTYHSSKGMVNASKKTKFTFDLAIFDEAHHTAGVDKALFQLLLNNNDIKIRKRLFMTATPKVLAGLGDNQFVKSMDDERVYGSEFYNLTIREAISAGIISDYKVMTLYCSNEQVRSMYYENIVFKDSSNYFDEEHLRIVSIAVSVCKAINKNNLKKVISYHSNINKAKHFELVIAQVASKMGIKLKTFHLNSTDNALTREKVVRKYSKAGIALITNARLLNEGFDIPAVDAVCFADERHSATDIVQAAGRAWRVSPGKEFGYILIPCLVGDTVDLDHDNVKNLRRTLSVLAGQDEQLAAYFRQRQRGRAENMPNQGEMVIHDNSSISLNFEELLDDINVKVWTNIRSLYYRSYTDAQQWVRENLVPNGIDTIIKWRDYVEGLYPELPPLPGDIPKQPAVPYKSQGWSGFPDFLGTKKNGITKPQNHGYKIIWYHWE
ncbi:DEAD/DEAH box helicase family protein [Pseudarcicella hirudinis]|uniref:DEAD/DEAH box helicase family protein n=1 Tax=Pseudarcicella hirudinis TaxID=1079859 RepID=UPI0035EFC344